MSTILVIDDEPLVCTLLQIVLTSHGYQVHTANSGRDGIEAYRQQRPHFTFLDLYLPDMTGIEVLKQIRRIDPEGRIVVRKAFRRAARRDEEVSLEREARAAGRIQGERARGRGLRGLRLPRGQEARAHVRIGVGPLRARRVPA